MSNAESSFTIRDARHSDRAVIGALWRELMGLHRALDPRFRVQLEQEQRYVRHIQEMMRSRDARVLVGESQVSGVVMAYIVGEIQTRPPIAIPGQYGFISDICVREDWRHTGVGRALFEEMRRWMVVRKATSIELYVAEANANASAFWKAMGFDPFLKLMHLDL